MSRPRISRPETTVPARRMVRSPGWTRGTTPTPIPVLAAPGASGAAGSVDIGGATTGPPIAVGRTTKDVTADTASRLAPAAIIRRLGTCGPTFANVARLRRWSHSEDLGLFAAPSHAVFCYPPRLMVAGCPLSSHTFPVGTRSDIAALWMIAQPLTRCARPNRLLSTFIPVLNAPLEPKFTEQPP